jgi:hypothetical protein
MIQMLLCETRPISKHSRFFAVVPRNFLCLTRPFLVMPDLEASIDFQARSLRYRPVSDFPQGVSMAKSDSIFQPCSPIPPQSRESLHRKPPDELSRAEQSSEAANHADDYRSKELQGNGAILMNSVARKEYIPRWFHNVRSSQ